MKLVALCNNHGGCFLVARELSIVFLFYHHPVKNYSDITLSTVPFSTFKASKAASCFRIHIAFFYLRFVFKSDHNNLGWSFHHKILNLIILENQHCYTNSKIQRLGLGYLWKQLFHLPHFKI